MPSFLKQIEVENFKSFGGNHIIGALSAFTAVIGPNGSGKSNLMDAISFVMGEKTSCLRVTKLSDLVHGACVGKLVTESVSVAAVFELGDGSERRFRRAVKGYPSEHRIDDQDVSRRVYLTELKRLNINTKAMNFLVFQGAVQSLASKSPKERTALFEEISRSGELKKKYDWLKSEKLLVEEQAKSVFHDQKEAEADRNRVKVGKQLMEKYDRLNEECEEKLVRLQLLKLFHNEKESKYLEKLRRQKQREVNQASQAKEEAEQQFREHKRTSDELRRELDVELLNIDLDVKNMEKEMKKEMAAVTEAEEKVVQMHIKVEFAQKSLATAQTAEEAHKNDVKQLEDELKKVKTAKEDYEMEVAGLSQSQGRDVQLEDEQVVEYNRLKEVAAKQASSYRRNLHDIARKQKTEQDKLDNEMRKRMDVENKYKEKQHLHDEAQKRAEKLKERIDATQSLLDDKKKVRSHLQSDLNATATKIENLQVELMNVCNQLGVAKVDQREISRNQRKAETVDDLQRFCSGVYDRTVNMCKPIHNRYDVAVTKVMGKHMEAIVVDTKENAMQCIRYLKEQHLESETFLPLDYIAVKPLSRRLRDIQEPRGIKLLYDVVEYLPRDIERAILFATNNALVCEIPEDACRVAYSSDRKARFNCVALDGTYYQKHGIISGGNLDLTRRAKRWDQNQLTRLESQRVKLTKELRESVEKSRKQSDLEAVNVEIAASESRLRHMNKDLEETEVKIAGFKAELETLEEKLKSLEPPLNAVKSSMATTNTQIKNIETRINDVDDEVFAGFCSQIGVNNIREYEQCGLRLQQEREKERMKFNNHIDRIENELDVQRSRDAHITGNVERWRKSLEAAQDGLKAAQTAEVQQLVKKDQFGKRMDELLAAQASKRETIDQKEEETGRIRSKVGVAAKKLRALQLQLCSMEAEIDQNKADRHAILMQCKIKKIRIPLLTGSMEDVAQGYVTPDDESPNGNTSMTAQQYELESSIRVDFSSLPEELKDLDEDGVRKTVHEMNGAIQNLRNTIEEFTLPDPNAPQQLRKTTEHIRETKEKLEKLHNNAQELETELSKVKKERCTRFMACFQIVMDEIDKIYKNLLKDQSAQAYLEPQNPEEPYLDGIDYNCLVPGKRFQRMSTLSGGEQTTASLALLFAIHSFRPSPFFVFDEIDAALDNENIKKVAGYIREKADSLQTIVISLKDGFYKCADRLIGICSLVHCGCPASKPIDFNLSKYHISLPNGI